MKKPKIVRGIGRMDAPLWLVGESLGEVEERLGEPFVGPSGRFLDAALVSVRHARADCRIENVVMERPPHQAPESWWQEKLAAYLPLLAESVAEVNARAIAPRAIVLIGGRAAERWLGSAVSILAWRGSVLRQSDLDGLMPPELRFASGNPVIVPTVHPAWIFRAQRRYTPVFARDLWRALHDPAPRPLPLPSAGGAAALNEFLSSHDSIERLVLDVETSRERMLELMLVGLDLDGELFQLPWSNMDARPLLIDVLRRARLTVGHNLADFDLDVLDAAGVAHHPPYHDTIAMLALVDANLPRGLAAGASRHVESFIQWKGVQEGEEPMRTVVRHTLGLPDDPWLDWGGIYNRFDIWSTGRLHSTLLEKVPQPLWDRAYVPNVERRRAMTARGMAFNAAAVARAADEALYSLAAVAAETLALAEGIWAERSEPSRKALDEAEAEVRTLEGVLDECVRGHTFASVRAPKHKCDACRAIYEARLPAYKAAKKRRTAAHGLARKRDRDFNIDSPADWAWVIYEGCEAARKRVRVRGEWVSIPRLGLRTTKGGRSSVDDADLRALRRKLQRDTARVPYAPHEAAIQLIELRFEAARLLKALHTNYEPLLCPSGPESIAGADGRAHPRYHDFKTRSGRYSSGTDVEEDAA